MLVCPCTPSRPAIVVRVGVSSLPLLVTLRLLPRPPSPTPSQTGAGSSFMSGAVLLLCCVVDHSRLTVPRAPIMPRAQPDAPAWLAKAPVKRTYGGEVGLRCLRSVTACRTMGVCGVPPIPLQAPKRGPTLAPMPPASRTDAPRGAPPPSDESLRTLIIFTIDVGRGLLVPSPPLLPSPTVLLCFPLPTFPPHSVELAKRL